MVDSDSFNKTHFGYYLFPMTWNFPSLSAQKNVVHLILLYSDFDLGPTESHLKCLSLESRYSKNWIISHHSIISFSHLCHFCVRKGYRLISYLHLAPDELVSSFLGPNPFNSFAVIVDIFISGWIPPSKNETPFLSSVRYSFWGRRTQILRIFLHWAMTQKNRCFEKCQNAPTPKKQKNTKQIDPLWVNKSIPRLNLQ